MKSAIVLACLVAAALAVPAYDSKDATIVKYESDNIGVGGYNYAYETSDGKVASEQAQLTNAGTKEEALEVRGQYSYPGPDGVIYTVTYVANQLGFQPQGAHLPQVA